MWIILISIKCTMLKIKKRMEQVLGADGALAALIEAKEKGKIRHIGVTGHIKAMLLEILKTEEIETVQFPFNPVETEGARMLLIWPVKWMRG